MRLIDADELIEHIGRTKIDTRYDILKMVQNAPTIEQEVKPIDYFYCSSALLRMWMDNVVTDGEYNRIMDKLGAHWK